MDVIIPAAGLSSRFPGKKPKYLFADFEGNPMIFNVALPLLQADDISIHVGIQKSHQEEFGARDIINDCLPGVHVWEIQGHTQGPADTVFRILKAAGLGSEDPIFIRDVDSFFATPHDCSLPANVVYVYDTREESSDIELIGKSYCVENEHGLLERIVEKDIVSSLVAVGGYAFDSSEVFRESFEQVKRSTGDRTEIFVSHVIEAAIGSRLATFICRRTQKYTDVGTFAQWERFNNRPTIFCDIDGCVLIAQARYGPNSYDSPARPIIDNVLILQQWVERGCQLVFVSARPERFRRVTEEALRSAGFQDFQLILGMRNAKRVLINDFDRNHPSPRAIAINLERNSSTLPAFTW